MLVVLSAVMIGDVTLLTLIASSLRVGTAWDSFVPDLIVGAITTGLLGVLLWYFTWRVEKDAERRGMRRGASLRWSVVGRRVANIVNTEDFVDDVTDASNLGPVAVDLIQLLQDEPLAEWRYLLNSAEIDRTLKALMGLEKTAALGRAINEEIRFWHMTTSFSAPVSLEQARAILIGESLTFDARTTGLTMGVKRRHMSMVLADFATKRNMDLDGKIAAYTLNRRQAEADVRRLRANPI
jgi:hypothetical protein